MTTKLRLSPSGLFYEVFTDDDLPASGGSLGAIMWWDGLRWVSTSAVPPNAGEVLQWDGSAWVPVGGGGGAPSGPAGNGLAGNYPNPTVNGMSAGVLASDAAHGNRGGQSLHPLVGVDGPGFMSEAQAAQLAALQPTAWDLVVTQLSDLPAPVGGVIDLTSGSYAFKNAVDIGANRIRVAVGVSVLIKGMGGTKILTGAGTSLIEVAGIAVFETLVTLATAGPAILLVAGGRMRAWSCVWESSVAQALEQTGGQLDDIQTRYTGNTHALEVSGGESHLAACNVNAGTGNALLASGALDPLGVTLNGCRLASTADDCLSWNVTNTDLFSTDTDYRCTQANGACIRLLGASSIQIAGGEWSTNPGSPGNGLVIELGGGTMGGLQLVGVAGEDISSGDASGEAFILHTSGTIRRATIQGCNTGTTVPTAINWTAASLPTLGLALIGNMWDDPTPYVGFSALSARCNAKANMDQGGLMQETPIVP